MGRKLTDSKLQLLRRTTFKVADTHDPSRRLLNEARFNEFYLSGEPETTPNYPLVTYHADVKATYLQDVGQYSLYLRETVTVPGQILIVENTDVSCACIRGCSPPTEELSPSPLRWPLSRIPQQTHEHLAHKFARVIRELETAEVFSNDSLPQFKCIEKLDARQHPPPGISAEGLLVPVNDPEGLLVASSWETRGPWSTDKEGAKNILDYQRVWNIIANNAMCFKVRSKSREQPSQFEICELWGMWMMPSLINHSCAPNCHATRVGDAIIIRAAKPIAAGTELTLPYFDIFQLLSKRELAAMEWGFRCSCSRCIFECSIGATCDDIQKQIVNLELQIVQSSIFAARFTEEQRRALTDRLVQKLADQLVPLTKLVEGLELNPELQSQEPEQPFDLAFDEHDENLKFYYDCICASFSGAFIAWYVVSLKEAYEDPLPQGTVPRTEKATRLVSRNSRVRTILNHLISVHPGSLFCQEFYSIAIKGRNEVIDDDLDEKLREKLTPQEVLVTMANQFSRYYYGPNVKVFESVNRP